MNIFREASISEFGRIAGSVYAPVNLNGDLSDYVKINKADLIRTLRLYEKTHVAYYRTEDNEIRFVEAWRCV